jgi:hypothetical protein
LPKEALVVTPNSTVIRGSCLCGEVRYELCGALGPAAHCHCVQCRKASGGSFATNASVSADAFHFLAGETLVGEFESSPGVFRCFCRRCGSPLIKRYAGKPDVLRLRLGTLDTDPGVSVVAHIFVRSKAPWVEIADDIPQQE